MKEEALKPNESDPPAISRYLHYNEPFGHWRRLAYTALARNSSLAMTPEVTKSGSSGQFEDFWINAEHVIVEIVGDDGQPSMPGSLGRVLVTTLENHLMPLVRYEIGDYAIATDQPCACGRTLPGIGKIIGRGVNLFIGIDGKRFVPWDLLRPLKDRTWIKQYQVAQSAIGRFKIRYVCCADARS